ncbi:OsmC family protein [Prolixibacteraceae bacterium Z1-6]|uniref:OsmC family protein n=1 Tax=Draconibacterium aestuarii TaxID=2998507 RepID=A0A9X3J657_9BACT|nr:OsmC family protein [Prolixibacteraceae bacterium Z1-6]
METTQVQKIDFSVESTTKSNSQSEIKVRNFNVLIDEPIALGGTDEAPNPVEYILCGLTGCMHILAFKVAKELNMELTDLRIKVEGQLNPMKLFGMPTEDRAGYQNISIKLYPKTNSDNETLDKWIKIMSNRSPVLDNVMHKTPVEIKLA